MNKIIIKNRDRCATGNEIDSTVKTSDSYLMKIELQVERLYMQLNNKRSGIDADTKNSLTQTVSPPKKCPNSRIEENI